ncbi:DMT family transporter [Candidatus Gracilibacteria bacterium]|nr:DMT family transporter [Candidatus Gracilibacteria bacterium]NJP19489.1 DMT family transporter [Hydrococcus sp. CRU_1_1]
MKNLLLPLGYASCWGVGLTLSKIALTEISPTTLLIIQLLSSVIFLYAACYIKNRKAPLSWKILKQGKAGIFEPALAYMFGTIGLNWTTVTNASLIGATEVVLTILLAALFLGEKLTLTKTILAIASFCGVFLLVSGDSQGAMTSSLIGDFLVILGVLFAVGYVLISKTQIASANPLELTFSQQFVGLMVTVIGFGVLSLFDRNYEINAHGITLNFWLLAVISGIMSYALAFLLYLIALGKVPVSQAAFYVALIPIFGIGSAIILIGDRPTIVQWIGATSIIASSYCANQIKNHK